MPSEIIESPRVKQAIIPARTMRLYDGDPICEVCFSRYDGYQNCTIIAPESINPGDHCYNCAYHPRTLTKYLVRTTAPESYDSFGTETYIDPATKPDPSGWIEADRRIYGARSKRHRIVAVLPDTMVWQEGRNRSGLHWWEPILEGEN